MRHCSVTILFMRLDMQSATWLTVRYLAGKPLTSYDILPLPAYATLPGRAADHFLGPRLCMCPFT